MADVARLGDVRVVEALPTITARVRAGLVLNTAFGDFAGIAALVVDD